MAKVNFRNIASYNIVHEPPDKIAELRDRVIQDISSDTLGKIPPASFRALDKRVTYLRPEILVEVTPEQIAGSDSAQIVALGARVARLSPAALRALPGGHVNALTEEQFQALGDKVQHLSPEGMKGIRPKQLKASTPDQLGILLDSGLLKNASVRVGDVFIKCLQHSYLPRISPEDMPGISDEVVLSITPQMLNQMEHEDAAENGAPLPAEQTRVGAFWNRVGINPDEISSFTSDDVAALSLLQVGVIHRLGLAENIQNDVARFYFDYRALVFNTIQQSPIKKSEKDASIEAMTPDMYRRMEKLGDEHVRKFWKHVGLDPNKISQYTEKDVNSLSLPQLRLLENLKNLPNMKIGDQNAQRRFNARLIEKGAGELVQGKIDKEPFWFGKVVMKIDANAVIKNKTLKQDVRGSIFAKIFACFFMTITVIPLLHDIGIGFWNLASRAWKRLFGND